MDIKPSHIVFMYYVIYSGKEYYT